MDELCHDRVALQHCALVCRSWARSCSRYLAPLLTFTNRAEVFEAHRERRWDWKCPLRVTIEGDSEQRRPSLSHFAAFVSLLGIKWSDVQSLSIECGSWHHTDFHPDVFTHLSVAPNNRHLALDDITLPSAVVFSNLITSLTHNFEGLRHYLSLCRIRLTALLDLPISWREGRRYPGWAVLQSMPICT